MNIYRVLRLGALNDLSAGAVTEAMVAAPDEGWARGVTAVEENDQAVAHHWLDVNMTRVYQVGTTTEDYDESGSLGDVAHSLIVVRKHSLHGNG